MKKITVSLCASLLVASVAIADAAAMSVTVITRVSTEIVTTPGGFFSDTDEFDSFNQTLPMPPAPFTDLNSTPATSGAEALGRARFGVLRAAVTAAGNRNADFTGKRFSDASSSVSFSDMLMVSVPGQTGANAFIDVPVHLHATQIEASATTPVVDPDGFLPNSTSVIWNLSGTIGAQSGFVEGFKSNTLPAFVPGGGSSGGIEMAGLPLTDLLFVNVPITIGTPVDISVTFTLEAQASFIQLSEGSGVAAANFGSTINWGGITSLRDVNGTPITDFTAIGGSGTDYASAVVVPVPGALGLMAGALLVAARSRWKRVESRAPSGRVTC